MKILACVTVGERNIIREWEANEKGDHLIVAAFGSESVAIPLDKSKIKITVDKDQLHKKTDDALSLPMEHFEALLDRFPRAFLGTLQISDAVIIKDSN